MITRYRIDQLRGDPDSVTRFPNAAFKDIQFDYMQRFYAAESTSFPR